MTMSGDIHQSTRSGSLHLYVKMKLLNIVLPARLGSNRVKLKNLRHLNGKPLIEYIIETTIGTKLVGELLLTLIAKFLKKQPINMAYLFIKGLIILQHLSL